MDIKKLKLAIEQSQKVCNEMDECANKFILQDSINEMMQSLPKDSVSECKCNEPTKCSNCDEMVVLVSSGEFCPSCYC